jgi:hypothetical protein
MTPGGARTDEHGTAGRLEVPGQRVPFDTKEKQRAAQAGAGSVSIAGNRHRRTRIAS